MKTLNSRPRPPMPLVPVALLLAAGITVGRYAAVPLGTWMLIVGVTLAASIAAVARAHLRAPATVALGALFAACGACLGVLATSHAPDGHVAASVPGRTAPLATVTGRIVTAPRLDEQNAAPSATYRRPPRTRFLLDSGSVSTADGPAPCQGLIRVTVEGAAWNAKCGQRVRIAGRLTRPGSQRNPGQYDWRAAAKRDGVLLDLTVKDGSAIERLDGPAGPISAGLWRLRARAREHIHADGDYRSGLLVRAMLVGDRHRALRDVNEAMVRAGVAHFLSISGLHLGVLLGFAYLLLRLAQVTPRRAAMAVLALLTVYLLIAEPRAPLLRAGIMAGAFCLAVILGRSAGTANLLSAAAIILLAAQPEDLFRPGFQLSFGIVAGILLLYRPTRGFLFGRWIRLRGLRVYRNDQRVRRWIAHRGFDLAADLVSVSVAAYLAALPLVAHHFELLTPLAPVMSLILFPLVAVTLIVGYGQMSLGWLAPNMAGTLSPVLGTLGNWLAGLAKALGSIPGICIELRPVPIWTTVAMAATILAVAHRQRLRLTRAWATVLAASVIGVIVVTTQLPAQATGQAELCVLDVRAGNCVAFRAPSGATYLFDAGSGSLTDPDAQAMRPFFHQRDWPEPSAAIVSHANADHYNALPSLLARHRLPRVFIHKSFRANDGPGAVQTQNLLAAMAEAGTTVTHLHRGQSLDLDDRTRLTVLWPPADIAGYNLTENDSSLVIRLVCDGVRVLLPGDIEETAQRLLLETPAAELKSDILILPHHGSTTPVLPAFIEAVDAGILIRSSGHRTTGAAEEIRALTTHRNFFTTDREGCITVRFTPDGPDVTGYVDR